jgi:hypothetical protein
MEILVTNFITQKLRAVFDKIAQENELAMYKILHIGGNKFKIVSLSRDGDNSRSITAEIPVVVISAVEATTQDIVDGYTYVEYPPVVLTIKK